MISIITAVYNQLAMNKIFLEYLRKNTANPFELIIIDNGSDDGSCEFFKSEGVTVIENKGNYAYPRCQNQGIEVSTGDVLCFLNNDIIVSKNWDSNLIANMDHNDLEVATCCGIERVESRQATKKLSRKWKKIKNTISFFSQSDKSLRLMHRWMYRDWDAFCEQRHRAYKNQCLEGFVGNTVVIKRTALEKIGLWDETVQAGDFDLFMRTKERSIEVGDIKPVHIALDTFNHHFIRLTLKNKPPTFIDQSNLIEFSDKWGQEKIDRYFADSQ